MAGLFIDVKIDQAIVTDAELSKKLAETCPVGIFAQDDDHHAIIVDDHLDECVLCHLCIDAAPPETIEVIKLYEV